jgi:RND superfamily putative drug exporter
MEMPMVFFAFLFGISMDYQVFIISRMREAYDRAGSTRAAWVCWSMTSLTRIA